MEDYLVNVATENKQKIEIDHSFYLSITPAVYSELTSYVDHYDTEVSGCGMVDVITHDNAIEYAITEVFLPEEQTNSSAYTEVDDVITHTMAYELAKAGKDSSKMRMHWHSHAKMGVFHSGTDVDNYATLLHQDFFISLVLNHDKDILGRIDIAIPFLMSVSGVPVYMKMPMAADGVQTKIDANLKALDKYIEKKDKEDTKVIGYDWRDRDTYYGSGKRKKKKSKVHDLIEDRQKELEDEIDRLMRIMTAYEQHEQDMYERCDGATTGKHTCKNAIECVSYNDILNEYYDAEAALGVVHAT